MKRQKKKNMLITLRKLLKQVLRLFGELFCPKMIKGGIGAILGGPVVATIGFAA